MQTMITREPRQTAKRLVIGRFSRGEQRSFSPHVTCWINPPFYERCSINRHSTGKSALYLLGSMLLLLAIVVSGCNHALSPMPATPTPTPTTKAVEPLTAIEMLDEHQGWALTATSILRTSDGGGHWKNVSPANVPYLLGLQGTFLTVSTAWVTAEMSESEPLRVLRTTDGGNHWDSISLPQIQGHFIGGPDFINPSDGWLEVKTVEATGNKGIAIYRTTDGGKTWRKVSSTTLQTGRAPGHLPWFGKKSGISFLTAQTGWATAGEATNIWFYVTHDGGVTWQPQPLTWPSGLVYPTATTIPPIFFGKDGLLPVLINDLTHHNLDLYVTHDGGVTWQSTSLTAPYSTSLTASDMNHIWILDAPSLAVTSDGGQHWNQFTPHADFTNVSALDFISSRVGWAIGGLEPTQSLLLKTTDGGHLWTKITYSIL